MGLHKNEEYICPLKAVDRRLDDVHRAWHQAKEAYFDPEGFRVGIQTAIQTLRSVTFILQSNKKLFTNFDNWYSTWQTKFKGDSLMRWMVDARNKIEKQGDLEAHSFVRTEIVASYYDEGPRIDIPSELFQKPTEVIQSLPREVLRDHVLKNGILRIQRRWVENTLPEYELLDAVGLAYGKLALLVEDSHRELGLPTPKTMVDGEDSTPGRGSRGGRLPCMIGFDEDLTINVWLATGEVMEMERHRIKYDEENVEAVVERYGFKESDRVRSSEKITDPLVVLESLFSTAKKVFAVDGHHQTFAFLFREGFSIGMTGLDVAHHGEKYLVMRRLAYDVLNTGADSVVVIGEYWAASFDPANPYRRAVDAPNKKEYLSATLITKTGNPEHRSAEIIRDEENVTLGDTISIHNHAAIAFAPIYLAWGREIPASWGTSTSAIHERDTGFN